MRFPLTLVAFFLSALAMGTVVEYLLHRFFLHSRLRHGVIRRSELESPALDNSSGCRMRVFEAARSVTAVGLVAAHAVRFSQAPEITRCPALPAVVLGVPTPDGRQRFSRRMR